MVVKKKNKKTLFAKYSCIINNTSTRVLYTPTSSSLRYDSNQFRFYVLIIDWQTTTIHMAGLTSVGNYPDKFIYANN